jgi:hypothetical protein
MALINPIKSPREHFRWAFEEQLRNRLSWPYADDPEVNPAITPAAMDAFDYVWRRYGLDDLDIRIGPPERL